MTDLIRVVTDDRTPPTWMERDWLYAVGGTVTGKEVAPFPWNAQRIGQAQTYMSRKVAGGFKLFGSRFSVIGESNRTS